MAGVPAVSARDPLVRLCDSSAQCYKEKAEKMAFAMCLAGAMDEDHGTRLEDDVATKTRSDDHERGDLPLFPNTFVNRGHEMTLTKNLNERETRLLDAERNS